MFIISAPCMVFCAIVGLYNAGAAVYVCILGGCKRLLDLLGTIPRTVQPTACVDVINVVVVVVVG